MSLDFLMCSERSGSNFITKLLNGHSNICGPSTKHIFNPVLRNLFRYEPLSRKENWEALLEDLFQLIDVSFSIWKHTFTKKDLRDLAPRGDINSLLRNIFFEEAKEFGKQHIFVKENQIYEFLPYLLIHFSESKYIYQVRDPRDMALSWKKNPVHPGGVVKAARQWRKDQQNNLKNFNELKKRNKGYLVTYENLISKPEKYTQKLVNFLGLTYEPGMMAFHEDRLTQQNANMQKAWNNLSKSVISDNKKKYQDQLTEREIKIIEKICFFEMRYLDYETEFEWEELKSISDQEVELLNKKELERIELKRTNGVVKNMEAKKIFYQQLL
ncbi:Sulfotransferase family protein [Fodinibius roseus]|uniref:Sulfotransferase family protein n=1 Tax=Fodinibius roseus TaxID=1194090 RepID=A0A1M5GLN5_9BACT|nr:sulfotransferase [Fodinibius roseus]SHG04461.1 Sulfotransferase family protein [Fodinibius roseus]